jgi:hypothetical protein
MLSESGRAYFGKKNISSSFQKFFVFGIIGQNATFKTVNVRMPDFSGIHRVLVSCNRPFENPSILKPEMASWN